MHSGLHAPSVDPVFAGRLNEDYRSMEIRRSRSGATHLPLSALLSQVLVAFTIEFDNEYERRIRQSDVGSHFLVSLVMWSNFMRFLGDEGLSVRDLSILAGESNRLPHPSLNHMVWWGYVVVEHGPTENGRKPPRLDWIVRPTAAGRKLQEVWRPLLSEIEERWQSRFDAVGIDILRESLQSVVNQLDVEMPHYLPVLGYGMLARAPHRVGPALTGNERGSTAGTHLSALISQALLAFTLEFERESGLSLAISANVVRVLNETGVRVRDLPRLGRVAKPAVSMAVGYLTRRGYVTVEPDPSAKQATVVRLTPKGRGARDAYHRLTSIIEERWRTRFGSATVCNLRDALESMVGDPAESPSPLAAGLAPHRGGWRFSVHLPDGLPHYPMVLHRGGWPDGS